MQQVSKAKLSCIKFHKQKNRQRTSPMNKISFTRRKSIYKLHEEKNQHATSFKNKRKTAQNYFNEQNKYNFTLSLFSSIGCTHCFLFFHFLDALTLSFCLKASSANAITKKTLSELMFCLGKKF